MAPVLSRFGILSRLFNPFSKPQQVHKRFIKSKSNEDKFGLGQKRIELAPVKVISGNPAGYRKLFKPFIFTISFCGCSYVGASIWQYESARRQALHNMVGKGFWNKKSSYKQGEFRRQLNIWWNNLSEGQRIAIGIISANVLVFLLWRIPGFQPTMIRYFTSNPSSKSVCLPMFLSTFSHYSPFHLACNMYVLFSFSSSGVHVFGKEQFMGFYLSAGVVSSFISYVHKIKTLRLSPSLGASGALMAILAAVCFQYPTAELSILFLSFVTFSAGTAIKVIMGVDAAGIVLGWRLLDHAAHLGGALFGIGYLWYGQNVWHKRKPVMLWWHNLREKRNK